MVAELIKENRKLKRQVVKLTERGTKVASSTVDRTLRSIQRRVQKALTPPAKRKRKKSAAASTTGKRTVTRRRRKAT
jgi:septum formation inhibitor MinC